MARKNQKQRQRQQLKAEKERRIMATQDVFKNTYLVEKILVEFRKLSGVGPHQLVQLSAVNKTTREVVINQLPRRVWWNCRIRYANPDDNRWNNKIGVKIVFLRYLRNISKSFFQENCTGIYLRDGNVIKKLDDKDILQYRVFLEKLDFSLLQWMLNTNPYLLKSYDSRNTVRLRKKKYLCWKNGCK